MYHVSTLGIDEHMINVPLLLLLLLSLQQHIFLCLS